MKETIDTEIRDVEALGTELELEKKASAGKDRKLSTLQDEMKSLKAQLDENRHLAEGQTGERGEERDRLIEIATALKLREQEMADKQKAVNKAIEKNIPIDLMLRGARDLDTFIDELAAFQLRTLDAAGINNWTKSAQDKTPPELSKLSKAEMARIPTRIWDKLLKEGDYGL